MKMLFQMAIESKLSWCRRQLHLALLTGPTADHNKTGTISKRFFLQHTIPHRFVVTRCSVQTFQCKKYVFHFVPQIFEVSHNEEDTMSGKYHRHQKHCSPKAHIHIELFDFIFVCRDTTCPNTFQIQIARWWEWHVSLHCRHFQERLLQETGSLCQSGGKHSGRVLHDAKHVQRMCNW
jgi:hypothetical protein